MAQPHGSIVVLGNSAMCTGFSLAGVQRLYPVATPADGEQMLAQLLASSDVGIVIVEEALLEQVDWRLRRRIEAAAKPVVVAIPGRAGPAEQAESLAKLVKRALGFDILARNGKKNK